jgi:SulP family sulfate permease
MTQTIDQPFFRSLQNELRFERLLPGLTLGVLVGLTEVIFALSVGSLIFSGELAPYLAYGIGIALVTATIMLISVSVGSSIPGVIASLQDGPSVILAVIAVALVGTLPAAGAQARLATVLVAIAVTALLTGAFFLALGLFKRGGLVRFLPYPVVGGFLAGTGWLLVRGSFGVMAGFPLTLSNLSALLQPDQLILWLPGVLLALLLLFGLRRANHFLTMPGILIVVIILFYLGLLVTGTSIDDAIGRGLLLGEMSSGAIWQPLALENLRAADWTAILGQSGNIAIILVVSVISLLLNASALELAFQQDIDLNRELRAAGLANILSGLGGGAVGFHALDLSTLGCRIGARSRLPGLVAGAICAAMLLAGAPLLAFFPKPILGGLLLFMGLSFLVEWLIDAWFRLPRADYAVVLLILVVIGVTNFLIGVGVGLVAMIVLFVLNYSRINVIRHALSGAEMKSNVERCAYHRQVLRKLGQQVHILELQGFIFFGTANALLERIRARVTDTAQSEVRYIVLDFRRVTGLDSSAVLSFVKGRQLAEAHDITLLLTHLSENIQHQFSLGGLTENGTRVRIFRDLDHGLEWCENQLLDLDKTTLLVTPVTLPAQLVDNGFAKALTSCLMAFLERVQIKEGEYLIRQGNEANALYFIEMGGVSVYLALENGKQVRLQTLGPGTVVGELGLYLGTMRTASVMADSPTIAYRLTHAALLEMKEKEPALAAAFHEFAVRLLSERLAATNRLLEAVLK